VNVARQYAPLASDPRLPQRDLLLDADAVAARLSAHLGVAGRLTISACERLRVKYRIGKSLRVLHRVRVGGRDYCVAARAFADGESRRVYEQAAGAATDCAPLRPVVHDAALETVFWTFPNDRRIRGLRALRDVPPELAQLCAPPWTRSRVVAYAPEKCATAQCLDEQARVLAYAKLYAGDEGRRAQRIYHALNRSLTEDASRRVDGETLFALPRALAYSAAHRTLLLEAIAGRRIAALRGSELTRGYWRLGVALAALHNLPVPVGLSPFKRLEGRRIEQAARLIAQARPDVRREAVALARELASRRPANDEPHACLHGDVHPKNAVVRGGRLTLIDLDQAAVGDAAADLGSLLASLVYNSRIGWLKPARARAFRDACLAGYASARTLPTEASLAWHMAAALLGERALRAVNRIRLEGLAQLDAVLGAAQTILRQGDAL
jgi:Ser/Thr protein kinase RdoA (MazF antagonist)